MHNCSSRYLPNVQENYHTLACISHFIVLDEDVPIQLLNSVLIVEWIGYYDEEDYTKKKWFVQVSDRKILKVTDYK